MTHHARLNRPARAVLLAGLIFFLSAFSFPGRKGAMPWLDNTPGTVPAFTETPSTPTQSPIPSLTYTPSESTTEEPTPSPIPSETPNPSSTIQPTYTPPLSETAPPSPTPTNTLSLTPSPANTEVPRTYPSLSVLINEVAWAGTVASSSDEWIELLNTTDENINLSGWILTDGDALQLHLQGTIAPNSFFLLERTDDETVLNVSADQIYSGGLRNDGEVLILKGPSGTVLDSANLDGGSWPGGNQGTHRTMERRGGEDSRGNWGTFTGWGGNGHDAQGKQIQVTPRQPNSVLFPTPMPTWVPGKIVINEVLIRPHYDWEGTGGVDPKDEFIELLNLGPFAVNLRGWWLDDIADAGSTPYKLPGVTLRPGEFVAFFRTRTRIALNDGGDSVRLLAPDARVIDQISYKRVRAYNLSYGRLPDGSGHLLYGLWPTAGEPNLLFLEDLSETEKEFVDVCALGEHPKMRFPRLGRHPGINPL
jgi:hypothetical protein